MSKLAEACVLSFNDWIATFPEEIPDAECSKEHERWRKKLFDKMRNDRYHIFTSKTVKIILVAAILSALLLSAFAFPSSREAIVDNFNLFSAFRITKYNNNYVGGEIKVGYIPEGYEFNSSLNLGKQIIMNFESNNGMFFTIVKYSSSTNVTFDTEFSDSEEYLVDGTKYIFCKGDSNVNNLIWMNKDYVYRISGHFNCSEMLKIAEDIE